MKVFESTQDISFGPIKFSKIDGRFRYTARTAEEESVLENSYYAKRGIITVLCDDGVRDEVAAKPAPSSSPSPAPAASESEADPWAIVEVPEVRTNRQGIEWLMANKGERFKVLSRDGLVALAARHGVSFPNLNPKKK